MPDSYKPSLITRVTKTFFGMPTLEITDFQIYNDHLFILEKNNGIYELIFDGEKVPAFVISIFR